MKNLFNSMSSSSNNTEDSFNCTDLSLVPKVCKEALQLSINNSPFSILGLQTAFTQDLDNGLQSNQFTHVESWQ